jgi:two-component system sensor histidine kinase PilS (NtrC family)
LRVAGATWSSRLAAALQTQLRWLIVLRMVAITSVSLPYFLLSLAPQAPDSTPRFDGFYLFAGAVYLASLIYLVLERVLRSRPHALAAVQLLGDVILTTGLVYLYGGMRSPFSMLYLVVIAIAAALLGRRGALGIAACAYALYASLLLALYFGRLAPIDEAAQGSSGLLIYNLGIHLVGFLVVALLTSYLADRERRATQQLQQETEALTALRVEHRDLVESLASGLVTTDADGTITTLNRAARKLFGAADPPFLGRSPVSLGLLDEQVMRALASEALAGRPATYETNWRDETGEQRALTLDLSPLRDAGGSHRGFILMVQDLTELRRLQQQLQLRDRMAAVGELAAGMAHEIGNPLAAISGSAQMLSTQWPENQPQRKLLEIVIKESQRLDRAIKGFLRFARPREHLALRFDIAALLGENVELLRNSDDLLPGHRVQALLEPPTHVLIGDPDHVSQIFWNLVRNALKAMPRGGTLQVEGTPLPGGYRLSVADDGQGMTAAEQADLFQPFRSYHRGTGGIGMAIVYRLVQEHGGTLAVDSRAGRGTTIAVELPSGMAPRAAAEAS